MFNSFFVLVKYSYYPSIEHKETKSVKHIYITLPQLVCSSALNPNCCLPAGWDHCIVCIHGHWTICRQTLFANWTVCKLVKSECVNS